MTTGYEYDPEQWLTTTHRAIKAHIEAVIDNYPAIRDSKPSVEMSFPDTRSWSKAQPLKNLLIHFEQDDQNDPILGFGTPGVEVEITQGDGQLVDFYEAAVHLVNFDVGVWVSAANGGSTKRLEAVEMLKNAFASSQGKQRFNEATGGLWPVSFNGGSFMLDRVDDLPVWRAMGMTLVVKVFSKHSDAYGTGVAGAPRVRIPGDIPQNQHLSIRGSDGVDVPLV